MTKPALLTLLCIALAGCGKLVPADASEAPSEESLLEAFVSEQIPKTSVAGSRSWTWEGAARMAEGRTSPFTTTVTVIALEIKKTEGDPPAYEGIVSWDCAGTGPYRCFESRYAKEETRYLFAPGTGQWKKFDSRHRSK